MEELEISGANEYSIEEFERRKREVLDLMNSEGCDGEIYRNALIEFNEFCIRFFGIKKGADGVCVDGNCTGEIVVVGSGVLENVDAVLVGGEKEHEEWDEELNNIPVPAVFFRGMPVDFNGRVLFCDSDISLEEPVFFIDEFGKPFFNGIVKEIIRLGENLDISFLVKTNCGAEFVVPVDLSLGGTAGNFSV